MKRVARWILVTGLVAALPLAIQGTAMASATTPAPAPPAVPSPPHQIVAKGPLRHLSATETLKLSVASPRRGATLPVPQPINCTPAINGDFSTDGITATVSWSGAILCNQNLGMSGASALYDDSGDLLGVGNTFAGFFQAAGSSGFALVPEGTFVAAVFAFRLVLPNGGNWGSPAPPGCSGVGTPVMSCTLYTPFTLV